MIDKCKSGYTGYGSEPRFVAIDDAGMLLLWCKKPPLHDNNTTRTMDLRTIHRIDFGHETLTGQRQPGVVPWHCFSLRTLERSYDFVCPDEDTTQCFVLAISRLLPDRVGAIPTRQKFVATKAWCKVRDVCRREHRSMHRVFVRAVHRMNGVEDKDLAEPQSVGSFNSSDGSYIQLAKANSPEHEFIGVRRGLRNVWSKLKGHDDQKAPSHAAIASAIALASDVSGKSGTSSPRLDNSPRQEKPPGRPRLPTATEFNAMQQYITGKKKWPKIGETWLVTDDVKQVSIYKDKDCTEWANRLTSKKGPDQNAVVIVECTGGERFAAIQGTGRMKFVRGWIEIVDIEGTWSIKPSFNKNW